MLAIDYKIIGQIFGFDSPLPATVGVFSTQPNSSEVIISSAVQVFTDIAS